MARKKQERNRDYVERGSERHAAILGLVADPDSPLKWKLADPTLGGPNATENYLREILRQKINDLTSPMPEVQSDDPWEPGYAPPMWLPVAEEDSVQGIVG